LRHLLQVMRGVARRRPIGHGWMTHLGIRLPELSRLGKRRAMLVVWRGVSRRTMGPVVVLGPRLTAVAHGSSSGRRATRTCCGWLDDSGSCVVGLAIVRRGGRSLLIGSGIRMH